ncbi:MAG: DUF1642 domain-containing protein [Streptococcaceae bacterium]|nr:DUF1642 domain-containing protein [Streptococcaceae bacterium]
MKRPEITQLQHMPIKATLYDDLHQADQETFHKNALVLREWKEYADYLEDELQKRPEKKKAVIHQFPAQWLSVNQSSDLRYDLDEFERYSIKCNSAWIGRQDHVNLFVRAWLDGYEVGGEKLYNVLFDSLTVLSRKNDGSPEILAFDSADYAQDSLSDKFQQFTENEIKAIDERYWQFAVPVEE